MELQEIEVRIGRDGRVFVEVKGLAGTGCMDLTRALEAALGGQLERELKPEAFQHATQVQQIRQGNA